MAQARRIVLFPFGCLLAAFLSSPPAYGQTTTLYVATNGNDSWSGELPEPNGPHTDGPLATLVAARNRVRSLKDQHGGDLPGPVDVQVRGGTYRITETIVFEGQDSGASDTPVTYAAYPGEQPVISGGRPITGWQQNGPLWTTHLSDVEFGAWWFTALFVDDELRAPSRDPNPSDDPKDPDGDGFFNTAGVVTGNEEAFLFSPGDIQVYQNPGDVYVMVLHAWDVSFHRIASIDETNHALTFKDIDTETPGIDHTAFENWGPQQRYCVFHAYEALDEPGEWWLDRASGTLYYYPKPGEEMGTTEVVAPVVERLVSLGTCDVNPVTYVNFEGLAFHHTDYSFGPNPPRGTLNGLSQSQVVHKVPGAIECIAASDCRIRDCEIAHISNYGIILWDACTNNELSRNHLYDLGGGGIDIARDYPDTSHCTIDNNWIHDGGKVFPSAAGVRIGMSSYNDVTHNDISNLYYSGISVGWTIGYGPSTAHDNAIEHNHVHHIGRGLLSDLGGIYAVGVSPGTRLHNNRVHDVFHYEPGYGGWGIYLDGGSSSVDVRYNVVYNCGSEAFHLNYGRENHIENNIFAWSHDAQLSRSFGEPEAYESLAFVRNIVYFNNDRLFIEQWSDEKYTFDYNCYWDVSGYPFEFPFGTFEQWQARGHDVNGIVADPLFLNPLDFEFALDPASPALTQLGFVPIDLSGVGLYGSEDWVNGPSQVPHDPTSLPEPPEATRYYFDFEAEALGSLPEAWDALGGGGSAGVYVSNGTAKAGTQSLLMLDGAGLANLWEPVAYLKPNYRYGFTALKTWLLLSTHALLVWEWRDGAWVDYEIGPNLMITDLGIFVNGSLVGQVPRNEWFFVQVTCPLGDETTGTFDLTLWTPEDKWFSVTGLEYWDAGFDRLTMLGLMSGTESLDAIYLDNFELHTSSALDDSDHDGILDWLDGSSDLDRDGVPSYLDEDSDGDGIPDAVEYRGDLVWDDYDEDGILNFLDTDSDNDGVSDADEALWGADPLDPEDYPTLPAAGPHGLVVLAAVLSVASRTISRVAAGHGAAGAGRAFRAGD